MSETPTGPHHGFEIRDPDPDEEARAVGQRILDVQLEPVDDEEKADG